MKNNKKISLFFISFSPGGGERVMLELSSALVDDGFEVDIVVVNKKGAYLEQVDKRVNIVDLDSPRIIFSLPKLMSYLRYARPGVILALEEYTHIVALLARKFSGIDTKVILRIGNIYSILFKKYKSKRDKIIPFIAKRIYKWADEIIAVSGGVGYDVQNTFSIPSEKISVINSPKNIDQIISKSQELVDHSWLGDDNKKVIISSGRLREQKDFFTLIKAFKLIKENKDIRLIIMGDGGDRQKLQELIDKLNLKEKVELVGFVKNPYSYLAKADIFVLPSLWEGLPNTLLEAMVCGLPVVSTDCLAGPREVLAPDSDFRNRMSEGIEKAEFGILVPMKDENNLAKALSILLEDDELRGHYKQKSLERSKDFEASKILEKYKKALGI